MAPVTYGERPPDVPQIAAAVVEALEFNVRFGIIPDHAIVRVVVFDGDKMSVLIGGLDDTFLFGGWTPPADLADTVPAERHTRAALTLWRVVEAITLAMVSQMEPQAQPVPTLVALQSEHQWRVADGLPTGVVIVADGEIH